jgi:signal transduction histidine kinase
MIHKIYLYFSIFLYLTVQNSIFANIQYNFNSDSFIQVDYDLITQDNYLQFIDSLLRYSESRENGDKANILCQIGAIYYRNFNFEKGIEYANMAMEIGTQLNNSQVLVRALRLFADNYYSLGRYDESIEYFEREMAYHQATGDLQKIAEVYCNIGVNYEERGNVKKGLENYLIALDLYQQIEDKEGLWATHSNMAFVYRCLGNEAEAIEQFEKASEIEKKYLDVDKGYYFTVNIAESLKNLGDFELAMKYLFKADSMLQLIDTPDDEDYLIWIDCYRIQGDVYKGIGMIRQAKTKYQEAWQLSQKARNIEKEGKVISALGSMMVSEGEYEKAAQYLFRGIAIAEETHNFYLKRDIYEALALMSAHLGKYKQAWEYQKLYGMASDSVLNIESSKQINTLQVEYETARKVSHIQMLTQEKEIQNLRLQKSESQKTNLAVMAFMLLLLSLIVFYRYKHKKRSAAMLSSKNHELSILNATKDKFFAIIAHDLKNPVSAFQQIAGQIESCFDYLTKDEFKYYIKELSSSSSALLSMLKSLLEWSKSQRGQIHVVPKEILPSNVISRALDEVKSLPIHSVANIVVKNNAAIPVITDEEIVVTVIRNLLSNALKFSPANSTVTIVSEFQNNFWAISVADQGEGISGEDLKKLFRIDIDTKKIGHSDKKGAGLGLIICSEFLQMINGTIKAESVEGFGSKFSILVPIKTNI